MQKNYLSKLSVLTAFLLCLSCPIVKAQTVTSTQNEVTAEADKTKLKSNDPNYNSKGKGGFIADFVRWYNDNSPFKPKPVPLMNPAPSGHGAFSQEFPDDYPPPAVENKNYYFSYGIGIGIAERGGKFKYSDGSATDNILYVQIPVMVRYSYIISNGATLFANAGPYYGIAVSGNYKDNSGTTKFKFGNTLGTDDYRRGDFGLKFGIGYRLKAKPIFIGLAAGLGLRNISTGGDTEVTTKNQSFGLQVGYVF